jgi:hypothetical protein
MKINWKALAKEPGYISLRFAYTDCIAYRGKWGDGKDKYRKAFDKIISKAKNHAHKTGKTIAEVLNAWEAKRDYNWESYYSSFNMGKMHSGVLKPRGPNGARKYRKQWSRGKVVKVCPTPPNKSRDKPRWTMAQKKAAAHRRERGY